MYGKVFESMFDGTLASKGPWQALVTFQQLIVLCDKSGVIDMTPEAISRRTSIPLEIIELGLHALMQPDPRSRTPAEEGRRITLLEDHRDWGWQIVNHAKYRDLRNAEERREYLRVAKAKSRARQRDASTGVNKVNTASSKVNRSTHTDADAAADTGIGPGSAKASPVPVGADAADQGSETKKVADRCPHGKLVALYGTILPECLPVSDWDTRRQGYSRTRWRENAIKHSWQTEEDGLKFFAKFFRFCRTKPLIMGQVDARPGGKPFIADLEWILRPFNFRRIIEGAIR